MAGDPTRTQAQARQSEAGAFQEWYVVTGGGASAFRMTPGLTVGESESGALALNDREPNHQWVEFVLADDGEPWATIVTRDRSLRVDDHTCLRHPLGLGATLRLPNNTLHISHDIAMPRLSGRVVEVVHRDIPQRVQDLVGPGLEEALAAVREPEPAPAEQETAEVADPAEPAARDAPNRPEPDRGDDDDWSEPPLTVTEPRPRSRAAPRQNRAALMTGVLAVGTIAVAGMLALLFVDGQVPRVADFDPVPLEAPPQSAPTPAPAEPAGEVAPRVADPVAVPAAQTDRDAIAPPPATPAPSDGPAATPPPNAVAEGRVDATPEPAPQRVGDPAPAESGSPPAADATASSEPPAAEPRPEPAAAERAAVAAAPRPEPEQPVPAADTPAEPNSLPEVSQNVDTPAEPPATPATGPDPALVAELEQTGLLVQAVAVELARRRDLHAADLALAQGRLTTPSDGSAYALYSRVLAADPGNPEAAAGLESVQQALINRALAQLAGDELDDAHRTLQAAAEAGADAGLVADLLAEVEYRAGLLGSDSTPDASR